MEIVILVLLFLVGTVGGAIQAMRYLERRQSALRKQGESGNKEPSCAMPGALLFDIIESPSHPDLAAISRELGYERVVFTAQRKALSQMKRQPPDLLVADFYYGYGNNYAGANVSNLDVLLRSLQRFAPQARVIVLADRGEAVHVPKLAELFELHAVITLPASKAQLLAALG